jgi:hypothetical protein
MVYAYIIIPRTHIERGLTSSICIVLGVSKELQLRPLLFRHMVLLLSGLLLLFVRWRVMASSVPTFQRVDNPASFADSILTRVIKCNEAIPYQSLNFLTFMLSVSTCHYKRFETVLINSLYIMDLHFLWLFLCFLLFYP